MIIIVFSLLFYLFILGADNIPASSRVVLRVPVFSDMANVSCQYSMPGKSTRPSAARQQDGTASLASSPSATAGVSNRCRLSSRARAAGLLLRYGGVREGRRPGRRRCPRHHCRADGGEAAALVTSRLEEIERAHRLFLVTSEKKHDLLASEGKCYIASFSFHNKRSVPGRSLRSEEKRKKGRKRVPMKCWKKSG